MPKQIRNFKEFVATTRRKDATGVTIIKRADGLHKFKVRCSKYLYTLILKDEAKIKKVRSSLPPKMEVKEHGQVSRKATKAAAAKAAAKAAAAAKPATA